MKVISVKKNTITLELNDEENNILFRAGLQLWIDKKIGANKVKVLPPDSISKKLKKQKNAVEIDDEFNQECIEIAVTEALKIFIEKSK